MAMPASSQGLKNRVINRSATAPAPIPVTAHQACSAMTPTPASTNPAAATSATTTAKGRASPSSQEWVARKGASALGGLSQINAVNSPWATMKAPRSTRSIANTSNGRCFRERQPSQVNGSGSLDPGPTGRSGNHRTGSRQGLPLPQGPGRRLQRSGIGLVLDGASRPAAALVQHRTPWPAGLVWATGQPPRATTPHNLQSSRPAVREADLTLDASAEIYPLVGFGCRCYH